MALNLRAPLALLLTLVLGLTACGGDDVGDVSVNGDAPATDVPGAGVPAAGDAPATDDDPADEDTSADDIDAADDAGADVDDAAGVVVDGETGGAPTITLPGGEPPSELIVIDLIDGDGAEAAPGSTVTAHYTGVSWLNDGQQFDSSWDGGEPIAFPLSGVIAGWSEGIPGMRVGGRRLLIIPPDMGYGADWSS